MNGASAHAVTHANTTTAPEFDGRLNRHLAKAEAELEWWYGRRDSAMGQRSAGLEPSYGADWDASAIWDLLERIVCPKHTSNVRQYYKVATCVRELSPRHQEVASATYAARAYPPLLREQIFPCDRSDVGVVTLAGTALLTDSVTAAFADAHGGKEAVSWRTLLEWVDQAVRPRVDHGKHVGGRAPHWVKPALREARALRAELLVAYDGLRRVRDTKAREAKDSAALNLRGEMSL